MTLQRFVVGGISRLTNPVVTLLPFPGGVGKAAFWPRNVFGEPSPLAQMASMLRHGRFEYLGPTRARLERPQRRSGDPPVLRSERRHARRQVPDEDAYSPAILAAVADRQCDDESWYPATILEALSISSLCISFYSAAVTEAVALGVPIFASRSTWITTSTFICRPRPVEATLHARPWWFVSVRRRCHDDVDSKRPIESLADQVASRRFV